jgi:hypothetical protein
MFRAFLRCIPVAGIATGLLLADFSYEQTSNITGGVVAGMMKVAGVFSRQAREPIHTTVAIKGDRMVSGNERHAEIIDLDKETFTTIDFQKKTWSVMTFAEMKQMMEDVSQKMKSNDKGEVHFKVSANATGQTRQISGVEAKEMIMKMEMETTDQKSGQSGSMVIVTNMWLAPRAAGYDEVREFHKRMAEKLNWTPGSSPMGMGQPDVAKGMAEVYKEAAKLDGMPVLQETKMNMQGQPGAQPADGQAQAQTQSQPQSQPQTETKEPPPTSASSAIASVLGGRFGRKKKPAADSSQSTTDSSAGGQSAPGSLLEMTTEMSNFSGAPVDGSRFEVPGGFKKVESNMRRTK